MFNFTLVTPQKKLLTDVEADEVIVPAHRGQLNILPGHAQLMTMLKPGVLKVRLKGDSVFKSAAISWGYLEVSAHGVSILADTAEWPENIDKVRVEEQLKLAEQRLQDANLAPADYTLAQRKIEKELARLDLFSE